MSKAARTPKKNTAQTSARGQAPKGNAARASASDRAPKGNTARASASGRGKKPRTGPRTGIVAAVLAVLAIAAAATFAYLVLTSQPDESSFVPEQEEKLVAKEAKFVPPVTVTISFAGDCTLGTDEKFDYSSSFNGYYDSEGPDYFFAGVKDIFTADDLTVVNCEGVLTKTGKREKKEYAYRGDPSYAKIFARSGVEAAGVANNHIYDYGWDSRQDTIDALENAGLTAFGDDLVGYTKVNGVKIALIAGNTLSNHLSEEYNVLPRIERAQEKGAKIIIVQMHWGEMEEYNPLDEQIQIAHDCIDAGATVVVGSHQHVLQGYEVYKGRYIVYGLGNFCYGGSRGLFDPDCYIFQQTFTLVDGEVQVDDDVTIYPCLISSDRSVNNYQPVVVEGEEADRVWKKIDDSSAYVKKWNKS